MFGLTLESEQQSGFAAPGSSSYNGLGIFDVG
ncbi:hypothetical protein SAHL_04350 [Salinisphaera orenii YIM 95161]|uniref:Uncharacterized protein n=1 Tax=Salinisphaera orenii YIM 95161 TaxID=1051139 RepID=A0A423Q329_9GAMM|nr:hypothetical protein SAHL_04350 [Salinisphaera halophila YIM 95161]